MDTLSMSGWFLDNENKAFSERIFFSNIPFRTGKYPLGGNTNQGKTPSSHFSTDQGRDIPNGRYLLDETSDNLINVKIADLESHYISGTFKVVYIRDPKDTVYYPYLPDTLRFTDGFFRVKLKMPR